jgi:hypothetical protein
VLKLLLAEGAIGERLSASMLAWRHSGFSVHNGVRVAAGDTEGRMKLAQHMLRAPLSLEKMSCDAYSTRVRGERARKAVPQAALQARTLSPPLKL